MAAQPPADKPAGLEQPPEWLASPPAGPAPSAPPPPPPSAPVEVAVYEQQAASPYAPGQGAGTGTTVLYSAGVIVLLAALVLGGWFVRGAILARQADAVWAPSPSPSPLLSDYEQADRFLNLQLAPAIQDVDSTLPALKAKCTAKLPPGCRDAIIATDQAMLKADNVIDKADIPRCIGAQMQQFQRDWRGMESGLGMAVTGYNSNSKDLTVQGLQRFASFAQYLKPDANRMTIS